MVETSYFNDSRLTCWLRQCCLEYRTQSLFQPCRQRVPAVQVALVHGSLEKVCPHFSTGRADYFGSTVNRAARLLCAAKSGQILAEAPVMDAVLKEWLGTPPHLPLASRRTKQGCLPDMSQACLVPTADSERDSPASGETYLTCWLVQTFSGSFILITECIVINSFQSKLC